AYRQDDIEVIGVDLAFDLPRALGLNYPEFPDSCTRIALTLGEKVADVLVNRAHVLIEQLRDLPLAQPNGTVHGPKADGRGAVLGAVKDQFTLRHRRPVPSDSQPSCPAPRPARPRSS